MSTKQFFNRGRHFSIAALRGTAPSTGDLVHVEALAGQRRYADEVRGVWAGSVVDPAAASTLQITDLGVGVVARDYLVQFIAKGVPGSGSGAAR